MLLRARYCVFASGLAWVLLHAPVTRAQAELETQQKANERLLELAKNTHSASHDYIIGRGDVVGVEVFDVPELSREVHVSQTGTIGLPLVPVRLFVAGLTELQVQQKIAEVLEANGLVAHPQVMVFVKDKKSKPIAVIGAVMHPGVYQADRPITLVEVLAESGGIGQDAGDTIIITRGGVSERIGGADPPEIGPDDAVAMANPSEEQGNSSTEKGSSAQIGSVQPVAPVLPATTATTSGKTPSAAEPPPVSDPDPPSATITVNLAEILERGDMQNNIPLQAGDVVTIPHAGIIYALGAVQRPGGFVANNDRAQLSTLKILALAGGTTRVAKRSAAIIIRKDTQGHQQAIPVDLAKIVNRESEDVQLRPSDILYVPDSHTKAGLLRFAEIALAVGTSLAIYRIANN